MKTQERYINDRLMNCKNEEEIREQDGLTENYKMNLIHYNFVSQIYFI